MTTTATMTAAALRTAAKASGLNVRVRKGRGCRAGSVHVCMCFDATREERVAAHAWLLELGAVSSNPFDRLAAMRPEFFDSAGVHVPT